MGMPLFKSRNVVLIPLTLDEFSTFSKGFTATKKSLKLGIFFKIKFAIILASGLTVHNIFNNIKPSIPP